MSKKKEKDGKTSGEIFDNDTPKKDSGLAERFPFPLSSEKLGIMGGRNVSLTALAKGNQLR